jgi:hypothetical protein
MRSLRQLLFAFFAIALSAASTLAQSTFATITGNVTDPNGALVPGVQVEATHLATNYKYTATSNEAGQYTLVNLREGKYTLRATATGFREFVVQDVELAGRDVRRIEVKLELGQVQTAIEVTAGATLIETESGRIADVKDRTVMTQLPLTLRRTWDYFQLAPTVSKPRGGWYIRFGGSRSRQGDVSFDGSSLATISGGPITGVLTDRTEGYQEMRIDSAGNSAEYAGIGQISIVTRAGTNQLHGSAFEYYTTPGILARNPFSPTATGSIEHVPGGSIGGPVYIPKIYDGRNRSFFYVTQEWERFGSPSVGLFNSSVPLAAWRKGDFSGLLPGTVIKDPFNNNQPFPNNAIPASRLNSVTTKVQDRYFPLPNYGDPNTFAAQNFRQTYTVAKPVNPTLTLRFDHRITEKSFVYARVTKVDWDTSGWQGAFPTIGKNQANRYSRASTVTYTQNIRPTLFSETRWGYSSDNMPSAGPVYGLDMVKDLGLQNLAPNLPNMTGMFNVGWSGIALSGLSGSTQCSPCNFTPKHTFQENLSWFRGRHSVKMGVGFTRAKYMYYGTPGALFGSVTFSNRFTGHAYADYLLGIPSTSSRAYPPLQTEQVSLSYSGFITDEFRLTPKLTVTYGIRYDLRPPFTEASGYNSMFDIGTGKIVVADGSMSKVSPLMPKGYVDVVEAKAAGFASKSLIRTDKNNFAPRLSVAWRPWGNDTVFRGGFGLFYDIAARNASMASVPFNISEPSYTNPTDKPIVLPVVFPETGTGGPSTVSIPGAINPDLRLPYSMQYTATIEHQRWNTGFRLSYVGTNTRQGVWGYDINQPVGNSQLYVDKARRFPNYPGITYTTNGAGHQYHSMTVEAKRVTRGGLHYQAYYSLARDIGDLEDGQSPEDAYNRVRERAVWPDIPTHRFSSNVIYDLPIGKGKPLLSGAHWMVEGLLGGWQLGGIFSAETGFFLTPAWTGPDPTGTRYTTSKTPPSVTLRPNQLRDANLSDRTPARWFDPTAFAPLTSGMFGSAAKGVIKGPGTTVLHGTLAKHFSIRERARLRLEFNVTNVLNHPNYNDPDTNISNTASVGRISSVVDRNSKMDMAIPRYPQLILRLEW